jgi:hypothetical protein
MTDTPFSCFSRALGQSPGGRPGPSPATQARARRFLSVTQPRGDHRHVAAGLKQVHRRGQCHMTVRGTAAWRARLLSHDGPAGRSQFRACASGRPDGWRTSVFSACSGSAWAGDLRILEVAGSMGTWWQPATSGPSVGGQWARRKQVDAGLHSGRPSGPSAPLSSGPPFEQPAAVFAQGTVGAGLPIAVNCRGKAWVPWTTPLAEGGRFPDRGASRPAEDLAYRDRAGGNTIFRQWFPNQGQFQGPCGEETKLTIISSIERRHRHRRG